MFHACCYCISIVPLYKLSSFICSDDRIRFLALQYTLSSSKPPCQSTKSSCPVSWEIIVGNCFGSSPALRSQFTPCAVSLCWCPLLTYWDTPILFQWSRPLAAPKLGPMQWGIHIAFALIPNRPAWTSSFQKCMEGSRGSCERRTQEAWAF